MTSRPLLTASDAHLARPDVAGKQARPVPNYRSPGPAASPMSPPPARRWESSRQLLPRKSLQNIYFGPSVISSFHNPNELGRVEAVVVSIRAMLQRVELPR